MIVNLHSRAVPFGCGQGLSVRINSILALNDRSVGISDIPSPVVIFVSAHRLFFVRGLENRSGFSQNETANSTPKVTKAANCSEKHLNLHTSASTVSIKRVNYGTLGMRKTPYSCRYLAASFSAETSFCVLLQGY